MAVIALPLPLRLQGQLIVDMFAFFVVERLCDSSRDFRSCRRVNARADVLCLPCNAVLVNTTVVGVVKYIRRSSNDT